MILLLPICLTSPLALPLATILTCIDLLIFLKFARHAPTWIYLHLLHFAWNGPCPDICMSLSLPPLKNLLKYHFSVMSSLTILLNHLQYYCSCALLSPIALKLRFTYCTSLPHTLEWKLLEGLYFCFVCLTSNTGHGMYLGFHEYLLSKLMNDQIILITQNCIIFL